MVTLGNDHISFNKTFANLFWIMMTETFEQWWEEVTTYCDKVGITTYYFEDEFLIDGIEEFVPVTFQDPITGENYR